MLVLTLIIRFVVVAAGNLREESDGCSKQQANIVSPHRELAIDRVNTYVRTTRGVGAGANVQTYD